MLTLGESRAPFVPTRAAVGALIGAEQQHVKRRTGHENVEVQEIERRVA